MIDGEAIYQKLPVPLQNVGTTLAGWHVRRKRYNAEFHRMLRDYRQREFWAAERIRDYRNGRLRAFVRHAVRTVPYYQELFRRERINAADICSLEDASRLPLLTKAEVQAAPARFLSAAPGGATVMCQTSGSTGSSLRFPSTWRGRREQHVVWWRYWMSHGLTLKTPCLYLGGRAVVPARQTAPPFWRRNRARRQTLFSAYHLNARTAPAYLEEMRRSGTPWLHGYPSMVSLLARYALQRGERLPLQWVTFGSENALDAHWELVRAAFAAAPTDHYGMMEAVANFSQCPHGRYHVDEDFAATEFLPQGGGLYRVVGTNLSNPSFPLLRYDTGDLVTLADEPCECGWPGRIVERLDGRREDYVIARDGTRLGRLDHIFKNVAHVREAQIRQSSPGRMTLHVVCVAGYCADDEEQLRKEIAKRVGDRVEFAIEYVDTLPRSANGKLRFVVSELAELRL